MIRRYVFEDPFLLSGALVAIGIAVVWIALKRDDNRWTLPGVLILVAGIGVSVLGAVVTTTAEEARAATKAFIQAAEDGRIDDMLAMVSPEATLHIGRPGNPGHPFAVLEEDFHLLGSRHRIKANSTNGLTSDADTPAHATVSFNCRTTTESSYGPVTSSWVLEWEKDLHGTWYVLRITAVKVAGKTPRGSIFP